MSKIRILAIPSDKHGVGKFRIMDPYQFIGDNHSDDVHVDISYNADNNDEYFLNYDIVVFHTFIHQTNHEQNIGRKYPQIILPDCRKNRGDEQANFGRGFN